MKLYIEQCNYCYNKISLSIIASDRQAFRYSYGQDFTVKCPTCQNTAIYHPHNVKAERTSNSAVGGGVVGGLVGLLGGPLGLLIGAGLGSAIGSTDDDEDKRKVNKFNSSF